MGEAMKAWEVQAAVDWPPGSARKWPGQGSYAVPGGNNRPAILVVAVDGGQREAALEALQLLDQVGHAWARVVRVTHRADITARALGVASHALAQAQEESRLDRMRGPAFYQELWRPKGPEE